MGHMAQQVLCLLVEFDKVHIAAHKQATLCPTLPRVLATSTVAVEVHDKGFGLF